MCIRDRRYPGLKLADRKAREAGYKDSNDWLNNDWDSYREYIKNDPEYLKAQEYQDNREKIALDSIENYGWDPEGYRTLTPDELEAEITRLIPRPYKGFAPVASQSSAQAPVQAPTQQSSPAPVASQSSAQAPVQAPTQQSSPAPTTSQSKPQRSYRQDDGTYVDEDGNIVYVPQAPDLLTAPEPQVPQIPWSIAQGEPGTPGVAPMPQPTQPMAPSYEPVPMPVSPTGEIRTPDQTPPGYAPGTSPGQGFAPTPDGKLPPQPKPQQQTPTGPSQADIDQYSDSRAKYYANLNKKAREAAEENLARIGAIDLSKQSASGRAQIAVNKLRAQRAAKGDKFSQEQIDRMVASDTKERFMTPEEKAARKERDRKAVEAMTQEAERRYGPGGGVTTVDPRGDNRISGTSMTYNQFRERYGREYDALSNDDANLVRGAASNWSSMRQTPLAQQTAQTASEFNRRYAEQNAQMAQRQGELDRKADKSQFELDRFKNLTPEQRKAEVQREISRIQSQPGFVQGVAGDMASGVQRETARQKAAREREEFNRRASQPGRVGVPNLLQNPDSDVITTNTPPLLQRPEGVPPEPPSLLQAPEQERAAPAQAPNYSGVGSTSYGQAPNLLQAPSEQPPETLIRNAEPPNTGTIDFPIQSTGGEVTKKAETMTTAPTSAPAPAAPQASGRVSPTAQPPIGSMPQRTPIGTTITPSGRPQPARQPMATPAQPPEQMNQPMELPDEQQTGGPSEANRAIPLPSENAFAIKNPRARGGAVTRAARTFRAGGRVA